MKPPKLAVAAALLYLWAGPVQAQVYDPQTGDPPSAQHVHYTSNEWKVAPTPDGENVTGTCRLDCFTDEYDQVFLRLKGLQSQGRYTVWVVNRDKSDGGEERAGVARHWTGDEAEKFDFTAEINGNGFYNGWLSRCPFGKWKFLEVRFHPNGNPKDVEGSVIVSRVKLKPL